LDNREIYRQLCKGPQKLPLFLQDWWLDVVCADWDAAIVHNGDNIAGVWPYHLEKKAGVTILRTPSLTPYIGPHILFPHDLKESKEDNFEYEVTAALLEKMPDAKVWAVSLPPAQKQVGLYKQQGFDIQTRQTFLMPLEAEEANIFLKLNEDYRRNIRKAEADIAIANEPEMLPVLRQYLEATLDRKDVKMHYSAALMQQLFNACNQNGACALWVARKAGEVQAILWHVWDEKRAYYLAGSRNPQVKDTKAMTALIWHAIKETKRMGKAVFDFEGSMDPGVEKFFRNFGANRELYLVLNKNNSTLWKLKTAIR
jgi:lipid II:glycine glycyltransferase (peptidoglycan interpeptide bridge formation enzyme)